VAVSPGGAFSSLASISEALSEPDMVAVGDGIPANGDPVPVPVPFPGGGGGSGGGTCVACLCMSCPSIFPHVSTRSLLPW
jgi:hypothetical protein